MGYLFRLLCIVASCHLILSTACWGYTCWYQQRFITDITAEQFLGGGIYLLKYLLN